MKVFISWSGTRSRRVAELLQWWMKCVIQAVTPWVSSNNIDRGTIWFSEIARELGSTTHGIICITSENKAKPWILFEAGALAKGLESTHVYTFLIDLGTTDLENPLAQFNATTPEKQDVLNLVRSINRGLEAPLAEEILFKIFETYWPQFDECFKQIIADTEATTPHEEPRSTDDVLAEILSSVRGMERRVRNMEIEAAKNKRPNTPTTLSDMNNSLLAAQEVRPQINIHSRVDSHIWSLMKEGATDKEIIDIIVSTYPVGEDLVIKRISQIKP